MFSASILQQMLQHSTIDKVFDALADPTRRAIVERLVHGPASVSELAEPFPMSLSAVGQHLQQLESSGLVRSSKVGRVRTVQLVPETFAAAERWFEQHRLGWQKRFDQSGEMVARTKPVPGATGRPALSRATPQPSDDFGGPAMEPRKRRRGPLTRVRILRRALRIADKQGLAALSMRHLAQALGVEAMSLYNHVKNKDDILDGLLEVVVSEIEVPAIGGDWRQAMRRRASSAHKVLMAHPWATMLLMSRISVGPAMMRYLDATLGCLRESGFSFPIADHAWNAIDSYIYGYTLQQLNFPVESDEYAATAAAFVPEISAEAYPYFVGLSAEVIARRHDGVHSLDFGLDLILDGLERLRLRSPPDPA